MSVGPIVLRRPGVFVWSGRVDLHLLPAGNAGRLIIKVALEHTSASQTAVDVFFEVFVFIIIVVVVVFTLDKRAVDTAMRRRVL